MDPGALGTIVRVDFETMESKIYTNNAIYIYGITVDAMGRVWTCEDSVGRFDPDTEQWTTTVGMNLEYNGASIKTDMGGCMVDSDEGLLWISGYANNTVPIYIGLDTETLEVRKAFQVPEDAHGIAIDFDGLIWGIPINSAVAHRLDPNTGEVITTGTLINAYTYSDMTGFALKSTIIPEIG